MRSFTFFTKSKEVHPNGLSIKIFCPDKNSSDEVGEHEESNEIEKIGPLAAILPQVIGAVAQGVGGGIDSASSAEQMSDTDGLPEADHWCPDVMDWHTSDHEPAKAPSVHINVDNHNGDDPYKSENADNDVDKEYDQKTNLPPEFGKPEEGESIAEPFLRKREDAEEDIEKQEGGVGTSMPPSSMPSADSESQSQSPAAESTPATSMAMAREYDQSLDVLKIWASVDRALPKDEELSVIDDLSILKSFGLETSTNIEDLIEGTLVHKMLVDRANRPTKEWWESGLELAKSVDGMEEPAICTAFLYYEPDTFDMRDFQKANSSMSSDPATRHGETQDVQNVGSASPIDGLGMSADDHAPEDKDCDT